MRVLGGIQRRGLDAARMLVDRFVESIGEGAADGSTAGSTERAADAAPENPSGEPPGSGVDAWVQLVGRSMEAFAAALRGAATPVADAVHVVLDRQAEGPTLRGCAAVWVHNTTTHDVTGLRPHCGELAAADGVLLGGKVTFAPECIARLGPSSDASVLMRVTGVDRAAPAGVYRGLVQVAGLDGTVLNVECEVGG
jgi:hypothetical protein